MVERISLEELRFRTQYEHRIACGDRLYVQLTLDDQSRKSLYQEVLIREVRGRIIWADFIGEGNAKKVLGPFLDQLQRYEEEPFELQLE